MRDWTDDDILRLRVGHVPYRCSDGFIARLADTIEAWLTVERTR